MSSQNLLWFNPLTAEFPRAHKYAATKKPCMKRYRLKESYHIIRFPLPLTSTMLSSPQCQKSVKPLLISQSISKYLTQAIITHKYSTN